jgi:hypothetical protein
MLAARLLSKGGYDCEREVRTLEMLKIRFGDAELAACEVMLRDVADSKRLDAAIRGLGPPMAAPAARGPAAGAARALAAGAARSAASAAGNAAAAAGAGAAPAAGGAAEDEDEDAMMVTPTASPRASITAAAAAAAAAAPAPAPAAAPPPPAEPPAPLPPGTDGALARLRSTIASHLFWPKMEEREFSLPPELKAAMEVGRPARRPRGVAPAEQRRVAAREACSSPARAALALTPPPRPQKPTPAAPQVYAERYHHLKAPRKLMWRPSLGAVTLEVEAGPAGPVEFRVTPLHAALLLQFAGREPADAASATALAAALGAPAAAVRRKALFWVNNGVLAEGRTPSGDVAYWRVPELDPSRIGEASGCCLVLSARIFDQLLPALGSPAAPTVRPACPSPDPTSPARPTPPNRTPPPVSTEAADLSWEDAAAGGAAGEPGGAAAAALAEMAPFENYILGVLTNFSAVALDRLHNLLRVFVVGEPKYEGRSQEQLAAYLQHLIAAGKVEADNGVYKRVKG